MSGLASHFLRPSVEQRQTTTLTLTKVRVWSWSLLADAGTSPMRLSINLVRVGRSSGLSEPNCSDCAAIPSMSSFFRTQLDGGVHKLGSKYREIVFISGLGNYLAHRPVILELSLPFSLHVYLPSLHSYLFHRPVAVSSSSLNFFLSISLSIVSYTKSLSASQTTALLFVVQMDYRVIGHLKKKVIHFLRTRYFACGKTAVRRPLATPRPPHQNFVIGSLRTEMIRWYLQKKKKKTAMYMVTAVFRKHTSVCASVVYNNEKTLEKLYKTLEALESWISLCTCLDPDSSHPCHTPLAAGNIILFSNCINKYQHYYCKHNCFKGVRYTLPLITLMEICNGREILLMEFPYSTNGNDAHRNMLYYNNWK